MRLSGRASVSEKPNLGRASVRHRGSTIVQGNMRASRSAAASGARASIAHVTPAGKDGGMAQQSEGAGNSDWQTKMQIRMQTQLQYQLMSAGGNWAGMSPHSLDTVEIDTLEDCDRINFLESSFRNYIEARDEELKEELQNPTETLSTKLRHGDKMFDEFLKDNSLRCSSLQSIASLVELMKENKQRRLEAEVDEEANILQNADAFHNAIEADLDADANEEVDEDDVDEEGELGKELGAGRDSYDL